MQYKIIMPSMAKGINGSVQDRLSDMPDEVILHILSFMPTLDAVKTMLLRRFGKLWTLVPALRFDFDEYYERMIVANGELLSIHEAFSCFARFVLKVLVRHRWSTIDTFHLLISKFEDHFEDPEIIGDVQMWLRFATNSDVKDLNFVFNGYDDLAPPSCVFKSQSLVTLTLSGCKLEHRPQLHMGTLRKLSLTRVHGSNEAFNQLISGCPSLQELVIVRAQGLRVLDIVAPSVSKLYLHIQDVVGHPFTLNCPSLKILDIAVSQLSPSFMLGVIDVSSLQVVNVKGLPFKCSSGLVKAILKQFQNAEVFTMSSIAFEQLSCMKKMDFPQNRWKRLVIQPLWNHERCLQVIFELMKSSVKLEELIIYNGHSSGNCELIYPVLSTSCVMPLLKSVTIHGYEKCLQGQLQLVEFLLRNAIFQEKLVITFGENQLTAVEELNFVKQVSRFRRASTNVTVVFA